MKIVILDKEVRRNIELFRHLIHRQAGKAKRFFQTARKTYKGYVNCKTGQFRFSELEKNEVLSKEWKPIVIQLRPSEEGAFEVITPDQEDQFDCSQFDEKSYALLTKTLHVLNQLAYDPKHGKNPFWVLKHIAVLDLGTAEEDESERNFIHEAWHQVDRFNAEYLLSKREVGTYLFRKDEFAQILEDILNENRTTPITCITLTFRDWDKKIGEKTLVYKENQWLFFNDDTTLSGKTYPSVRDLLASLGNIIKKPLFAD